MYIYLYTHIYVKTHIYMYIYTHAHIKNTKTFYAFVNLNHAYKQIRAYLFRYIQLGLVGATTRLHLAVNQERDVATKRLGAGVSRGVGFRVYGLRGLG